MVFRFTESDSARREIADRWLTAPLDTIRALKNERVVDPYGDIFEVSVTRSNNRIAVTVLPVENPQAALLPARAAPQNSAEVPDTFSGSAGSPPIAGRWTYYRDAATGDPVSIEVYPLEDPSIILTLRPGTGVKSLLDLSIYGLNARKGVPFGMSFSSLLTAPVSSVAALTERTVPWDLVFVDTLRYGNVASGVLKIREGLRTLVYLEDGAFDETGEPVYIKTGAAQDPKAVLNAAEPGRDLTMIRGGVNCSGFTKWIVDGIIRPTAGSGTFISALKRWSSAPETGFTERYRETNDVFFALDWTRNLAAAVVSLDAGYTVFPSDAGIDVTVEPFSGASGYETDVGYPVRELMPMLYYLAAKEGGHWYLGALSRERGERGNAVNPLLRYYHHAAAFFPWFDEAGRFHVAVFENAEETPAEVFTERNRDAWIFLTRVDMPTPARFVP